MADNSSWLSITLTSKVNLVEGYLQMPIAVADVHKTIIVTPFGLFEWCWTPFGIKYVAQAIQVLMDIGKKLFTNRSSFFNLTNEVKF